MFHGVGGTGLPTPATTHGVGGTGLPTPATSLPEVTAKLRNAIAVTSSRSTTNSTFDHRDIVLPPSKVTYEGDILGGRVPFRGISLDFVSKELTPRPLPAGPAFCQIVGHKLSPSHSPVNGTFVLQSPTAPHLSRSHLPCCLDIPLHLFSSNVAEHSIEFLRELPEHCTGLEQPQRSTSSELRSAAVRTESRLEGDTLRRAPTSRERDHPPRLARPTLFVPVSFARMAIFLAWYTSDKTRRSEELFPATSSHHAAEGWLWAAFLIAL